MRCRDARVLLLAQREEDSGSQHVDPAAKQYLWEHLRFCSACRAFEQRQQRLDLLLTVPEPQAPIPVAPYLSTDKIMRSVQQQRKVSQQLENIRSHQQSRFTNLGSFAPSLAAVTLFTLGSIPLIVLAITILQPGLLVQLLGFLDSIVDIFFLLMRYSQAGAMLIYQSNWFTSGFAFVLVVMMGIWLRLMRHPQTA